MPPLGVSMSIMNSRHLVLMRFGPGTDGSRRALDLEGFGSFTNYKLRYLEAEIVESLYVESLYNHDELNFSLPGN